MSSELEEAESEGSSSPVELFAVKEVRRRGSPSYSVRPLQPERTVRFVFPDPNEIFSAAEQTPNNEMQVDLLDSLRLQMAQQRRGKKTSWQ